MNTRKRDIAAERASEGKTTPTKRKLGGQGRSPSDAASQKKGQTPVLDQVSSQSGDETNATPRKRPLAKGKTRAAVMDSDGTSAYDSMYKFSSSRNPREVVDLTSSPENQPRNGFGTKGFGGAFKSFNPNQPKTLTVKNLRAVKPIDGQTYLEKIWPMEEKALTELLKHHKEPVNLEELYKAAEHTCRMGKAPEMYNRLKAKIQEHLSNNIRGGVCTREAGSSDVEVLRAFVSAWSIWQRQLQTLRQIFYYMDQVYLLRSQENPSVTETGVNVFRSEVFQDPFLEKKVMQGVVNLINLDRKGQISEKDSRLLREAIDALHDLSIYSAHFEPKFQETTESYFRDWRESEAQKDDLAKYINNCANLLDCEMLRCDVLTLDRSTRWQISSLFDTVLIEEEVDMITNHDSILDILEQDLYEEMSHAYTLLQRKGHAEKIAPTFGEFVETEGASIVFNEKEEADMVMNLLDFKRRLDRYLKQSFQGNELFGNTLHKSFEIFMNKTKRSEGNWGTDNSKTGEMIAKHVDLLLKGGIKAIPGLAATKNDGHRPEEEHDFDDNVADEDAEINKALSDALDLFRFVHGKAVFEAFYKKDLARRLLMGRSASFDAERNMLTRLKNECGASFTHNLESMFKDMDLAREEMMSYNQTLEDRGPERRPKGPDLAVNVLSASAWPTYPDVNVNVPPDIATVIGEFEKHYKAKHSGRKLTWKHNLAHCQLRARFAKANKELVVSGFQAIVLLSFNDIPQDGHLSYSDLRIASGLPDVELKRTLQSLACAKYRVLTKHPRGRDVNDADTFTFNASFTDAKMRIKINQIQLKETKEENRETHKRVAADRHYETQAAIVRIMKSRKKIKHNDLIIEVINATKSRGVLDQTDIKANIDRLIDKDYMERIEDEPGNWYAYVA